ncbi:MAG: hypothetical protein ACRD9R_11095 [Pyrinomonadaceae bacterium]
MNELSKLLFAIALTLLTLIIGGNAEHIRDSAQNKDIKQFMVGVLKANGTLVPFAEYRRGVWWNPWPEPTSPAESNEVGPKSLGDHPEPWFQQCEKAPTTWYFWSAADSPLVLKTSGTLQVENHSQTNWALMTDYPKKQNAEKDSCHDYVGMALNVDLKVDGMVEIEKNSDEASKIIAYLKPIFSEVEASELSRLAAEPTLREFFAVRRFPLPSEERAKVELTLTKLYRSKPLIDGQHIYYFEVEKHYQKPVGANDRDCFNVSLFSGWIMKDKDSALDILNESFGLTNCDGKERGNSVEWFSVVTLNMQTFLLAVEHGWEDESYTIYELKDHGLTRVLETLGG